MKQEEDIIKERYLRANVRCLVRDKQEDMIHRLCKIVCQLHNDWPNVPEEELLTNTRIHGLCFAINPTKDRQTPQARLEYLKHELTRMRKQAEKKDNQAHKRFYTSLQKLIWTADSTQEQASHASAPKQVEEGGERVSSDSPTEDKPTWLEDIVTELRLRKSTQQQWEPTIRLMLAEAVLDTFVALYTTQPLQQELDMIGKAKGGYRLCL